MLGCWDVDVGMLGRWPIVCDPKIEREIGCSFKNYGRNIWNTGLFFEFLQHEKLHDGGDG